MDGGDRVVLSLKRFSSKANGYVDNKAIRVRDLQRTLVGSTECGKFTIDLNRGGQLTFYANLLPEVVCDELRAEIDHRDCLRQYEFGGFKEGRAHCLLNSLATNDSEAPQPGYTYHHVVLKASALDEMPKVASLANNLAVAFNLEDHDWKVGVDVLKYRDNNDRMGWHADDTHHESLILSVTVGSPAKPRHVQIKAKLPRKTKKTKKESALRDGDEFIVLYPGVGDGYAMDGIMQNHYLHCVPKTTNVNSQGERHTIVFRDGDRVVVKEDSGIATDGKPLPKKNELMFGRCDELLTDGTWYKRMDMMHSGSHGSDFRGVSGNATKGCNAIVVANQDDFCASQDHLYSFMYLATTAQGARALYRSFSTPLPIRVFRSSKLVSSSPFAPEWPKSEKSAIYRYDGIYFINQVMDDKNNEVVAGGKQFASSDIVYRFILFRAPAGQDGNILTDAAHLDVCLKLGTLKKEAKNSPLLCPTRHTARTSKRQKRN